MAKKGFIGSFFKALIVAVVVFFIVFFFAPEMSQKYLGTSYKHDKTKVDAAVQDSVSDLMSKAKDAVSKELSDPAVQKQLVSLAKQTGTAFQNQVKDLAEKAADMTAEQKAKLEKTLSDPKTVDSLKKAAEKGGKALEQQIDSLIEAVSR